MEWQPVDVTKTEGIAYLALVGLSSWRWRRQPADAAVSAGVDGGLGLHRGLAAGGVAASSLGGLGRGRPGRRVSWRRLGTLAAGGKVPGDRRSRPRAGLAAWLLPLTGAVVLAGATLHHSLRIGVDPRHAAYPVRAVAVLRASGVRGNMAVFFNWGQYVIWRLGPRIKVSYDGRRETVYPESLRALNNDWVSGVGRWDAILDEHPTDLALLDKRLASLQPHAAEGRLDAGL